MTSPKHPHPHPAPAGHPAPAPVPTPAPAQSQELAPVKSWAYPFATNSGKNPPATRDYLEALGAADGGFYPLGANGIWHGGIHFDELTAGQLKQDEGVRAIADGEVIAYRLDSQYPEITYSDNRNARYSTGFVLIHHKLALPPLPDAQKKSGDTPKATPPAGEGLDFYSLYMHLLDFDGYTTAERSDAATSTSSAKTTPTIRRMKYWKGTQFYRVSSRAKDTQRPLVASPGTTTPFGSAAPPDPGAPSGPVPLFGPAAADSAPFATSLATGLHIYDKANGKVLGLLPQGSELTVTPAPIAGWGTIASISKGAPVATLQGADPEPGAAAGWIRLDGLDSLIDPNPLDAVVVLDKPFRVKAGDPVGYLGQYIQHSKASTLPASSISRPLLHLEVFAGDAMLSFISKSRERAAKLSDDQKGLLVVLPGAALVDVLPAASLTVPAGATLEPVTGNSSAGPWKLVQPTRTTPAHHPTKGHPHPKPNKAKVGDVLWVDQTLVGQVVPDAGGGSGSVPGWSKFPLQLSNPKLAPASFLDVFTPSDLARLDGDAKAMDDQGVKWWKIQVGTGSGQAAEGWVSGKGHPQTEWQSPWAWPGFEIADGTSVKIADVFKRSIAVSGLALPDEEVSFQASAVAVNSSELFSKVEKAIDKNGSGTITAAELAEAYRTPWLAEAISHLVVRYESEWGGGTAKWDELTPLMKERSQIWESEVQRIKKLQWWDQVKAAKRDFPQAPTVYHFHPIGLVGNFLSAASCIPLAKAQLMALTITSGFEGGHPMDYAAVAGNFDGMGMSYGLIQWNAGSGSLCPVLSAMHNADSAAFQNAFPPASNYSALESALLAGNSRSLYSWAVQQQSVNAANWKVPFENLAKIKDFKDIQLATAVGERHKLVLNMLKFLRELSHDAMKNVELVTYCALFDLSVQQTSLDPAATSIKKRVSQEGATSQRDIVRIAVEERAKAAKHIYVADCMSRRIGILQQAPFSYTAYGVTSKRTNSNLNIISQDAHKYVCQI